MKGKLIQLNSQIDFFNLTAHPDIKISDMWNLLIQRVLEISNSQIGICFTDMSTYHADEASLIDCKQPLTSSMIKRAWLSPSGWTDAIQELANRWLAMIGEDKRFAYLSCHLCTRKAPSPESSLEMLVSAPSSLWLPLLTDGVVLGWIGIGAEKAGNYSISMIESLTTLLSKALVVLNRLLLRDHGKKQGMEINFVGVSEKFLNFEQKLRIAARQNRSPVLIRGERGSGKELAAYALHYFSERRDKPFVPVLISALCDGLQTDELFGHLRNSFTGANTMRKGKFLAADGGTLFLDEVADIPEALQVALLRVIERGEIQVIGQDIPVRVNVRIVAATNQDLSKLIAKGRFREDLYDRLNILEVEVPPLRDRLGDIAILAGYFLLKQCHELNRRGSLNQVLVCQQCDRELKIGCVNSRFYEILEEYKWPGNVRELENLIIRLTTNVSDAFLDVNHLPEKLLRDASEHKKSPNPIYEDLTLNEAMRKHLGRVLNITGNNQTKAAQILGIPRTTLQLKMKKLGLAR